MEDVKAAAQADGKMASPSKVARTLCIGERDARALLSGGSLPVSVLDEIGRNLYHREDGSLRVRLFNIMSLKPGLSRRIMRQFRLLARMVQDFRPFLKLTDSLRNGWDLPPMCAVKQAAVALEDGYAMLVRMHRECPEFDSRVFSLAKELLEEIRRDDRKPRKRRGTKSLKGLSGQPRGK